MPGFLRRTCVVGIALQVVLLLGLQIPSASAASTTGTSLTTSPIAVDISANPGTSTSTILQVQNNSSKPETISVRLYKFGVRGNNGQPAIFPPVGSDTSVDWVHFSQTKFVAQPQAWNKITMTIDLPSYAALGYYYSVLFVPNPDVDNKTTDANTIKGANAILVLLDTHSKNEHRQLQIQSFTASKGLYEYLPATFNVLTKNSGNIHLIPGGNIYISRSQNGKAVDTLDINPGQGNVLPYSSRQFQTTWSDGLPVFQTKRINGKIISDKHDKPIQQLQWSASSSFSKIRFGKYYAHLVLVYNDGSRDIPVEGVVSFWVIPWKLILLVIALVAALAYAWKGLKKLLVVFRKKVRGW